MAEDSLVRFGDLFAGKRLWDFSSGQKLSPSTYIRVDENGNPIRNDAGHLVGPVESDPSDIVQGVADLPQVDFVYNTQTGQIEPIMNIYSNDENAIQEAYLQEQEANRQYLLSDQTPSWMQHDIYLGDEVGNNSAADANADAYIQNQIFQNNWLNKYYADKYRNDEYKTWGSILAGGLGTAGAAVAAPVVAPFMPQIIGDIALGTAIDQVPTLWGDKSISEAISEGANNLLGTDPNSWQGQLVGGIANLTNPSWWISGGVTHHLTKAALPILPALTRQGKGRVSFTEISKASVGDDVRISRGDLNGIPAGKYKVISKKDNGEYIIESLNGDRHTFYLESSKGAEGQSILKNSGKDFTDEEIIKLNNGETIVKDKNEYSLVDGKLQKTEIRKNNKSIFEDQKVPDTTPEEYQETIDDNTVYPTDFNISRSSNIINKSIGKIWSSWGRPQVKTTMHIDLDTGIPTFSNSQFGSISRKQFENAGILKDLGGGNYTLDTEAIATRAEQIVKDFTNKERDEFNLLYPELSKITGEKLNLLTAQRYILKELTKDSPAIMRLWRKSTDKYGNINLGKFKQKLQDTIESLAEAENAIKTQYAVHNAPLGQGQFNMVTWKAPWLRRYKAEPLGELKKLTPKVIENIKNEGLWAYMRKHRQMNEEAKIAKRNLENYLWKQNKGTTKSVLGALTLGGAAALGQTIYDYYNNKNDFTNLSQGIVYDWPTTEENLNYIDSISNIIPNGAERSLEDIQEESLENLYEQIP